MENFPEIPRHSLEHDILGVKTRTQLDTRYLQITNNLSDVANAGTARTNLGLGALAVLNDLSTFDTGDLVEGSNLYYTDARVGTYGDTRYVNVTGDTMTGALTLTPTANSTTTFQVNQADGTNVLTVDTTNARVGIGTTNPGGAADAILAVRQNSATHNSNTIGYITSFNRINSDVAAWYMGADTSNNAILTSNAGDMRFGVDQSGTFSEVMRIEWTSPVGLVGIGETSPGAKLQINTGAAATKGLIVKGAASQSANLLEIQDSGGSILTRIDETGALTLTPTANSTTTFQVNQADTTVVFNVDTTNARVGIGTATPNEQLELTGNFRIPDTTATAGIIYMAGSTFIHEFGTRNTFIGTQSGNLTLTGSDNVGLGYQTLLALTSGNSNMAFGSQTCADLTEGSQNVGVGNGALRFVTTGDQNMAIGQTALFSLTDGNKNVAIGQIAMRDWDVAGNGLNTAIGDQAMYAATGGVGNAVIGAGAGTVNLTGSYNTWIGHLANAVGGQTALSRSIAIGRNALVGASNMCVIGGTAGDSVQVAINATSAIGQFDVNINAAARIGQIIKLAASQSANAFEVQDSDTAILLSVEPDGDLVPGTDSAVDLGSSTPKYFANAYIDKLFVSANNTIEFTTDHMSINKLADEGVYLFEGAVTPERPEFRVYGYATEAAALQYVSFSIDTWGGVNIGGTCAMVQIGGDGTFLRMISSEGIEMGQYNADSIPIVFGEGNDASIYYNGTNLVVDPQLVGTGYLSVLGSALFADKVMFTQTDGNEYIDSDNDNYLDLHATTAVRVHTGLVIPIGTTPAPAVEGALFLDTDAGANGTLVMYSNGGWRTVTAF